MTNKEKEINDLKKILHQLHRENSRDRDKYVFAFSSSILTVSLTFVDKSASENFSLLVLSWFSLFLCMVVGFLNFHFNEKDISSYGKYLKEVQKISPKNLFRIGPIEYSSFWNRLVKFCNLLATICLLLGMFFMVLFAVFSLNG